MTKDDTRHDFTPKVASTLQGSPTRCPTTVHSKLRGETYRHLYTAATDPELPREGESRTARREPTKDSPTVKHSSSKKQGAGRRPVSRLECLRRWRTGAKRALQPNWRPIDSSPEHAKPRRSRAELVKAGRVSGPSRAAKPNVSLQHAQPQARMGYRGPQLDTERLRRSTRFCKSLTKLAEEPRGPFTLPV